MSAPRDVDQAFEHEVYRIWDEAGNLLYVGMGRSAWDRVQTHLVPWHSSVQASWLMNGLMDSWHIERFPTKVEARDAERSAIRSEHPLFNKHHNKGWQLMRDEYFMAFYDGEIGALERQYTVLDPMMPTELSEPLQLKVRDWDSEQERINDYVRRYDLRPDKPHPFMRQSVEELRKAIA